MKHLSIILFIAMYVLLWILPVSAQDSQTSSIYISGLKTGSNTSAKHEFVAISNLTTRSISVEGWRIQYQSQNGTSWLTKATLEGVLEPDARLEVATKELRASSSNILSSGFSSTGGKVRLLNGIDGVIDQLSWHATNTAFDVIAPSKDETIEVTIKDGFKVFSLVGGGIDEDGAVLEKEAEATSSLIHSCTVPVTTTSDSDNQSTTQVQPVRDYSTPETGTSPNRESSQSAASNTVSTSTLPIVLSELMPDPVSPMTDADDEFVEIFNPSNSTILLDNYYLETGKNFKTRSKLSGVLQPLEYRVFFSNEYSISLANKGQSARLVGIDNVIHDTQTYPKAIAGLSWSLFEGGKWDWTSPSPATAASLPIIVEESDNGNAASVDSNQQSVDVSSEDDGRLEAYANSQTTSSELLKAADEEISQISDSDSEETALDWAVLAGVGCLGVLYAGYEHRSNLYSKLTVARSNRSVRRKNWLAAKRWRGIRFIK